MSESDGYLVTKISVEELKHKIMAANTLPGAVELANDPANFISKNEVKREKTEQ